MPAAGTPCSGRVLSRSEFSVTSNTSYANGGHPAGLHTTALGAGPEVYNNMAASHNCVGGSEQGCIPEHPPVADPSKTGMGSSLPPPASW